MSFTPVNPASWERRDYLECFRGTAMYLTARLGPTALYGGTKQRGLRLYAALVYCAAKVVNQYPTFHYGRDKQSQIRLWDYPTPLLYDPAKGQSHLFSMKYTEWDEAFSVFFFRDYALAEECGRLICDETLLENSYGVTIAPRVPFSSFRFGGGPNEDFIPITVYGKFEREGERLLPAGGELFHAVNDGLHIGHFFEQLQFAMNRLFPAE